MNLKKKMERYLRVNLLGPGPRLMKKEFTGPGLTKAEKHCSRIHKSSTPELNGGRTSPRYVLINFKFSLILSNPFPPFF